MKKAISTLILLCALSFSILVVPSVMANEVLDDSDYYKDLDSSHWAYESICYMTDKGLVKGQDESGQKVYQPERSITRAEFVAILARMCDVDISGSHNFIDVDSGTWYNDAVGWAYLNEIVYGTSDDTFEPDKIVTRQEMVSMTVRFVFGYLQMEFEREDSGLFDDSDQFADYAKDSIQYMKDTGLIVGKGNNCFEPLGTTTRAEAAELLSKICEILVDNMDLAVKNYILEVQSDKSEAERLKWAEDFLVQLNTDDLYAEYLAAGNDFNNVPRFAEYITENAPVPDNWKELFEADLYDAYQVEATRYEQVDEVGYQVYVTIDGKEVAYVTVDSRTGYYHG